MKKFMAWWQQDKRYRTMLKAVLMAALPVLCCLVYAGVQGQSLRNVYLPGSEWNDELFYYKQVEGIVHYGYPQGYFGFNESHALRLSFAAWSPVLVFPWILWGLLFGWNLMSPILCNIVLLSITMFVFVWLVKPTWKQVGVLTLLFSFFTLFVRYMLSGMPEIICFCMLILFYGLALHYQEREKKVELALLFGLAAVMTLMRPYLLLFLLLPIYFAVRKWKWKGAVVSALTLFLTVFVYALIKHYLGAEYFAPLFFTDWITTFFREGIGAGVHNLFGTLFYMGRQFVAYTVEGVRSGLAVGAYFFVFLLVGALLLGQGLTELSAYRRGQKKKELVCRMTVELHLGLSFVAMLFALLLMYKLIEGSKHLLTFVAAGIFVVSLMETKAYKKAVLLAAVFAYLFTYRAGSYPYDFQVPFAQEERVQQAEKWQGTFADALELEGAETPNFDNVVIWVLYDAKEQPGENESLRWQLLYELPEGFGISCCMPEYVAEHMQELQSRYLATVAGGEIDGLCAAAGYEQIGRDEDMVVYKRY